ncbi:hypothetical protein HU200_009179 [Digitaria exilis]|uniref:Uncharacterized protein n=1 Tax=Digitaria exilis TaxID=1010633 RepID=A0A835FKF1_9POAL|nr:hypothetical protein HU200_009179 [Digitaria exilis]CAB3460180.1 unnamed protein product [Digitaria exilis]
MDPMFNAEWSASEIKLMKAIIAYHDANNSYANGTSKKGTDILDELQARFSWKEKHQVTDLYVELVVEMMQAKLNDDNQPMKATSDLVNDNFGLHVEDPAAIEDNMDVSLGYVMNDTTFMRMVEKAPQRQVAIPREKRQNKERTFWTIQEHRNFLRGLEVYGRGSWKNISRSFVTTKTPVQISSHAQKYFLRLGCPTGKQRYSINDVSLHDFEPWRPQNHSSGWEALSFSGSSNNSNNYGSRAQHVSLGGNMLMYHASQESSIQAATWARSQQIRGGFLPQQWLYMGNM